MPACLVQIYEIQTPQEAEAVVALGVDRVGSVLPSEADRGQAELRDTIATVRACGARSSLIPLFRDEAAVARALDYYRPDVVHFCDALSGEGRIAELIEFQFRVKERFPEIGVMRSIPIAPGGAHRLPSLAWARELEPATDVFLTDTLLVEDGAEQPVEGFVGITGRTCDWALAGDLVRQSRIPVILAGGISPLNAAEAVARVRPAGVDSCTLTNAVDAAGRPIRFRKDLLKVKTLVEAVRRAEITS